MMVETNGEKSRQWTEIKQCVPIDIARKMCFTGPGSAQEGVAMREAREHFRVRKLEGRAGDSRLLARIVSRRQMAWGHDFENPGFPFIRIPAEIWQIPRVNPDPWTIICTGLSGRGTGGHRHVHTNRATARSRRECLDLSDARPNWLPSGLALCGEILSPPVEARMEGLLPPRSRILAEVLAPGRNALFRSWNCRRSTIRSLWRSICLLR